MRILAKGAEGMLYLDENKVLKDRVKKPYRHEEIDKHLRKSRTNREAKIFEKLEKAGFPAPRLIKKEDYKIWMEFSSGDKLKDLLEDLDYKNICFRVGHLIRILHNMGIIHGDLTTSNILLEKEGRIVFIDFGLSFFSEKIEDKAVDLHLMKQALDSSHYKISEECFEKIIDGYDDDIVFRRFLQVDMRGRNKGKS